MRLPGESKFYPPFRLLNFPVYSLLKRRRITAGFIIFIRCNSPKGAGDVVATDEGKSSRKRLKLSIAFNWMLPKTFPYIGKPSLSIDESKNQAKSGQRPHYELNTALR
jgi:hypothetical protein